MQTGKKYTITVDDDPMISSLIQKFTGLKTISYTNADEFLAKAETHKPVACFIDVHLDKNQSGIDFISRLSHIWAFVPLIVMTSDPKSSLIAQALASGASDFVRKPLQKEELVARLQARLSEMAMRAQDQIQHIGQGVTFNYRQKLIQLGDQKSFISPLEADLLSALLSAKGMLVAKSTLKRKLWGELSVSDNALDRRISDLRKSLRDIGSEVNVESVYGEGLQLSSPSHSYKKVG